ncbi:MAG: hypothetical protein HFH34_14115 [Eubacterium sp.]|nr:hypothetical protein [Eubacterium sp.]
MAKRKKKQEVILTPEQQREADYQKAVRRMEGAEKMLQPEDKVHMYKEAIRMFEELGDYEDCEVRKKRCRKRLPLARREYREEVYQTGMQLKQEAKSSSDYEAAIAQFRRLRREYKDIPDQIEACMQLKESAYKKERVKNIWKKLISVGALAAIAAVVVFLCSPAAFYLEGSFLMNIRDYERANTIFAKSKGYKDTKERVRECNYQRAVLAAQEGDYGKAVRLLHDKVGDYKDALEKKAQYEMEILMSAGTGDTVIFGTAKWLVADIDEQADRKLLVRKKPVKAKTVYQEAGKSAEWEISKMRTWLNDVFWTNSFSSYEQKAVLQTEVVTAANSRYGTAGGNHTSDRVFLLDEQEAQRYQKVLHTKDNRRAWWLRTPGKAADSAAFVSAEGVVMRYGYAADSKELAVRPAVWVGMGQ